MQANTNKYKTMPTIAVYFGGGGLTIKDILYGIEDYVVYISYDGVIHKRKIYYTTRRPYFMHWGARVHLDECLKTEGSR